MRKTIRTITDSGVFRPAMFGFTFWGLMVYYRTLPQSVVFLHLLFGVLFAMFMGVWLTRRLGDGWHQKHVIWVIALLYAGACLAPNYNVLFFYLMAPVYYPFPPPTYPDLRAFAIFSAIFGIMVLCGYFVGRGAAVLEKSDNPRRAAALGIFGFALGLLAANAVTDYSWPLTFILALFAASFGLAGGARSLVAALAAVGVALGLYAYQQDLIYTGSLQNAVFQERADSVYARNHLFTYNDETCVTVAGNFHSITYNCSRGEDLPQGLTYFFRGLIADKQDYRVLSVGRTLGMYQNTLLWVNPNAEYFDLAEFDHNVMTANRDHYSKITDPKFIPEDEKDYKVSYFAGDLSRYVLSREGPYDLVFYNGTGLSQYQIPFLFPYHEQWLFTPEVMNYVFDELLEPDGVLVIDWGSRSSSDQQFHIRNIPEDVHLHTFWYLMTDPPFTSNPLYYFVATRDANRLAGIVDHLNHGSYYRNITKYLPPREIETTYDREGLEVLKVEGRDLDAFKKSKRMDYHFDFDRPFMQFELVLLQLIFLTVLAGLSLLAILLTRALEEMATDEVKGFLGGLRDAWRKRTPLLSILPLRRATLGALVGFAFAIWWVDIAAHQAHQLEGYGYVWPAYIFLWLCAAALSFGLGAKLHGGIVVKVAAAAVAIFAAFLMSLDIVGFFAAMLPVVVSGAAFGLAAVVVFGNARGAAGLQFTIHAFAGLTFGFVGAEWLMYLFGFDLSIYVGAGLLVFAALRGPFVSTWQTKASGEEEQSRLDVQTEATRDTV